MAEPLCTGTVYSEHISFARNFGKESAIYSGLESADGDYVALIDADLQHPPYLLVDMLQAIEVEGYDCATARRVSREKESKIRYFSRMLSIILSTGQPV